MEDVSLLSLLGRLVVSLAVVFGLMAVAGKAMRRRGLGPARGSGAAAKVELVARHGLGRNSSVAVVRVAGKTLVLGVGESSVTLLAEADPLLDEVESALAAPQTAGTHAAAQATAPQPRTWSSLVESLRDATARRT